MDDRGFDALTRLFADGPASRRRVVKGLASGALGTALAALGRGGTEAACKKEGEVCVVRCCNNLVCDRGRCRRCGKVGESCQNRRCCSGAVCSDAGCSCGAGRTNCNGLCRDLNSDPLACGGCFNQCLLRSQACQNGRCCTVRDQRCPSDCRRGQGCDACCSGFCRKNGTCGPR